MLVTTQQKSFMFDGHHFLPIGIQQGLSDADFVSAIAAGPDHRTIVAAQRGRIFVAIDPVPFSLTALHFHMIILPSAHRFTYISGLAPFGNGVAIVTATQLGYVDLSDPSHPQLTRPPDAVTRANRLIGNPHAIFGTSNALWISTTDGRICVFAPRGDNCWKLAAKLPHSNWSGFVALPDGRVMARSGDHAVVIDPRHGTIRLESIPDTSPALKSYSSLLSEVVTSDGDIMTQAIHGVAIRHDGVWRAMTLTNGDRPIMPLAIDGNNAIWLGIFGEGIRQYFNYGDVTNWTRLSGLSSDVTWGTRQDTLGRIWIATEAGLDMLGATGVPVQITSRETTESIAIDSQDNLWLNTNAAGLQRYNTRTGANLDIPVSGLVTAGVATDGTVWVATGHGLYRLADALGPSPKLVLASAPDAIFSALSIDPDGTLWLTGGGTLWRKPPGGTIQPVVEHWGVSGVDTESVTHRGGKIVWVGAASGLFQVDISGATPKVTKVPDQDLPGEVIAALLIDHRGNVWAGTSNGLAVLHAGRWVSAVEESGLVGNDIAQDGISEDRDGSIWISTSAGVSHLIHPDALWRPQILHPAFARVLVDGRPYAGGSVPRTRSRLDAWVSITGTAHGGLIRYRYKLADVDDDWQELTADHLSYPLVPPGRHRLLVTAVDPLTHMTSEPISLTITVAQPWWWRPWALALDACLIAGVTWAILRLRTRYLVRQSAWLQQRIDSQTRDLKTAHADLEAAHQTLAAQSRRLEIQAHHDALTGLLNRGAIQKAVAEALADADQAPITVGLIDLDYFKRLNDTHGHLVGDAVLVALGLRFRNQIGPGDLVGRFGGEEYVLSVPGGGPEALARIEAIIDAVTSDPVAHDGLVLPISVSAGVAAAQPGDTWEAIIGRADAALYRAKREGRARIATADDPLETMR